MLNNMMNNNDVIISLKKQDAFKTCINDMNEHIGKMHMSNMWWLKSISMSLSISMMETQYQLSS